MPVKTSFNKMCYLSDKNVGYYKILISLENKFFLTSLRKNWHLVSVLLMNRIKQYYFTPKSTDCHPLESLDCPFIFNALPSDICKSRC